MVTEAAADSGVVVIPVAVDSVAAVGLPVQADPVQADPVSAGIVVPAVEAAADLIRAGS